MKKTGKTETPEAPGTETSGGISRRDFFGMAWKGLGLLAVLEVAGMITAYFMSGKKKDHSPSRQLIEAGSVESFGPGTVTAFFGGRFYLARLHDGGFIALSLRCTHLGCSVTWEEKRNRFICPCHSSAFNITGEVLNPPAARALSHYPVVIENGIVMVDAGVLKERKSFRNEQLVYAL